MKLFDNDNDSPRPRATLGTVELRTAQVVRWLQQGLSRGQVVFEASEKWGIAPRTVDTYLARARDIIKEASEAQTRGYIAHQTGLGRRPAPVDTHGDTQPLPDDQEPPTPEELINEVGGWIRRQYTKADIANDTRAGLQAAGQMAKLFGLNFDDRTRDELRKDLDKPDVDPVEALRALLAGSRESRERRGLASGGAIDAAQVRQAVVDGLVADDD